MFNLQASKISFSIKSLSQCDRSSLFEAEKHKLLNITAIKRRKHYIMGRQCAHQCVMDLTGKTSAILNDKINDRMPLWPISITGSISHSNHYAVCIAAYKSNYQSVGVDIEHLDKKLNLDIKNHILTSIELKNFNEQTELEPKHALMLYFSAKEAIYKCMFPILKKDSSLLKFKQTQLKFDYSTNKFSIIFLKTIEKIDTINIKENKSDQAFFKSNYKLIGEFEIKNNYLFCASLLT